MLEATIKIMLLPLFLLLILSLCFCTPRVHSKLLTDGEYISRERTTMINGFFIWLVFLSHINGYKFDLPYGDKFLLKNTVAYFKQCVVATFFFFSGYGLMYSLKKKGINYAFTLLNKRFWLLLLHFGIAILIYVVVNYFLGTTYSPSRILLSIIAWDSVGNSNWFIFITLLSYLFIAFSYIMLSKFGDWVVTFAVSLIFCILIPMLAFKGTWWVDTCLCIPAGMLFCLSRKKLESSLQKLILPPWLIGIIITVIGVRIYRHPLPELLLYCRNLGAILFAAGLMFAFSCISLKRIPAFLCWSGGSALFSLYIFQRIPMLIGARLGWHTSHPYLYEAFCIIVTITMACISIRFFNIIDNLLIKTFSRKPKNYR